MGNVNRLRLCGHIDFSPPRGPQKGRGHVALSIQPSGAIEETGPFAIISTAFVCVVVHVTEKGNSAPLVCVHAFPMFVAKCQTGTLSLVCGDIGRKSLSEAQQEYTDIHGFYHARVEHLLACLWQWRIIRNVWIGSAAELHGHVHILLHLTQFCIRRQTSYQPYGPWPHAPESLWAQEEATIEEEENDDGVCCQLCRHEPGDISVCGTCHLNMCVSCIPLHSCTLQDPVVCLLVCS